MSDQTGLVVDVNDIESIVRGFEENPTEADRVTDATLVSGKYAKHGFNVAVWALIVALVSAVISLIAVFK